jgi:hypothetical protein
LVRDSEVLDPVAIEIADCKCLEDRAAERKTAFVCECSIAIAKQDSNRYFWNDDAGCLSWSEWRRVPRSVPRPTCSLCLHQPGSGRSVVQSEFGCSRAVITRSRILQPVMLRILIGWTAIRSELHFANSFSVGGQNEAAGAAGAAVLAFERVIGRCRVLVTWRYLHP